MASAAQETPFDLIGGSNVIRAIVERFYDLMDSDPAYAELRAMHAADLSPMRTSLAGFLNAWSGGPRDWFETRPGACVMSLHRPLTITKQTADQWIDAMNRAIADTPIANQQLAASLGESLSRMATGMARG
jgi:hemoglobin